MDQHVTYHPITDELLQSYRYYISGDDGARVAGEHCAAMGMDEVLTTRFTGLLPHFAAPADYPFDQTHGFSIALTQGFFGPYFYVNGGQLSALGELIAAYVLPWQQVLPDWDMVATAHNTVLSQFSSGVFIPADKVASFMSDAHAVPELSQALGTHFPGHKLGVLWAALQYAHDAGSGLLEAAGALEPNLADLSTSVCFTRLDHCDQSSLQVYAASQQAAPEVPAAPELPVPPHLADRVSVNAGERLPSTPSLTERLRAKRGDTSAQTEPDPATEEPDATTTPAAPEPEPAQPPAASDTTDPEPDPATAEPDATTTPAAPEPAQPPAASDTTHQDSDSDSDSELAAPPATKSRDHDGELPPPPAPVTSDDDEQPRPPTSDSTDNELRETTTSEDDNNTNDAPQPPTKSDSSEELPAPATSHNDDEGELPPPPPPAPSTPSNSNTNDNEDDNDNEPPPPPPAPSTTRDNNTSDNNTSDNDDELPPPPPAPMTATPGEAVANAATALDVTLARGVFASGETFDLVSGSDGPAAVEVDHAGWQPNRLHWSTHVEGHAAALMRQHGLQELELTTNHPDGVCRACDFQAPAMMSPGATLIVHTPDVDGGTRTQWITQDGVHDHDPGDAPVTPSADDRIRLRPGGCWGQGSVYFDTWDNAWEHVEGLIGMYPFFFDVTHMGNAWEPFALVGTQQGTAVIEFIRSASPFRMRLHGLGMVSPEPELLPVQVQWTADESHPVMLGIDVVHQLSPDLARETADLLITTADRSTLAFNEVAVFGAVPQA